MLGIICAMQVEADGVISLMSEVKKVNKLCYEFTFGSIGGRKTIVALSGIGKANAAAVTALLLDLGVSEVINLGVCGGTIARGSTIIADSVVQYDFDTTALGDELGKLDGFDSPFIRCSKEVSGRLSGVRGVIASGDKFVADGELIRSLKERFGAIGFDMESGAVAQICAQNHVPFAIARVVSDGGNADEYFDLKKVAALNASKAVKEYLSLD